MMQSIERLFLAHNLTDIKINTHKISKFVADMVLGNWYQYKHKLSRMYGMQGNKV